MPKSRLRLVLALILLCASLILLLWGVLPAIQIKHILPIPAGTLTLPTPAGFLPGLWDWC